MPIREENEVPVWPRCLSYSDMLPKHEMAAAKLKSEPVTSKRSVGLTKLDQIEMQFLGTVSAQPTPTRAHSCLALRLGGEVWLFDAGENAQLQLTKSTMKSGKVNTIFLTHLHGDHVFGLGPLVCSLAQTFSKEGTVEPSERCSSMDEAPVVIEIYGPLGTRAYLRNVLRWSYSFTSGKFRVHELLMPGEEPGQVDGGFKHPCEEIGLDIYASLEGEQQRPIFRDILVDDQHRQKHPFVRVHAAPIRHTVPTLGYVIEEEPIMGNIPTEYVQSIKDNHGVSMSVLKDVKAGRSYTLPNGVVLKPPDKIPGRKICILGDTCDPSNAEGIARGSDVLVHEATNAFVEMDPETKESDTKESVQRSTISHGHSTPEMAGAFANRIHARALILNHFSARYKGDDNESSVRIMEAIKDLAKSEFRGAVYTARDWSSFRLSSAHEGIKYLGVTSKYTVPHVDIHKRSDTTCTRTLP